MILIYSDFNYLRQAIFPSLCMVLIFNWFLPFIHSVKFTEHLSCSRCGEHSHRGREEGVAMGEQGPEQVEGGGTWTWVSLMSRGEGQAGEGDQEWGLLE